MEVNESDRVCQASAMMAIEPVMMPTQYFKPKRRALTNIDIHPSHTANRLIWCLLVLSVIPSDLFRFLR
jgi:hypothetical protein